jgi:hypothetical protein
MNAAATPPDNLEGLLPGCFGAQDPNFPHRGDPGRQPPRAMADQWCLPLFVPRPGEGDVPFGLTPTAALIPPNTSLLRPNNPRKETTL